MKQPCLIIDSSFISLKPFRAPNHTNWRWCVYGLCPCHCILYRGVTAMSAYVASAWLKLQPYAAKTMCPNAVRESCVAHFLTASVVDQGNQVAGNAVVLLQFRGFRLGKRVRTSLHLKKVTSGQEHLVCISPWELPCMLCARHPANKWYRRN